MSLTCPGEVVPKLVEGHGHDSVRCVKRFLHPIPMMDVDVNVQHPLHTDICKGGVVGVRLGDEGGGGG